jgi:hypothetical protein
MWHGWGVCRNSQDKRTTAWGAGVIGAPPESALPAATTFDIGFPHPTYTRNGLRYVE